jgi:hypothetical protein
MPYYFEKKGTRYKLRLKDDPERVLSNKYITKAKAKKQMQAIEINKRKRNKKAKMDDMDDMDDIEGGGFFGDMYKKFKTSVSNIISKVVSVPTTLISKALPDIQKYTRKADTMLKRYGHFKVINLYVERQPVNKYVMKLANVLTTGELDALMKKGSIDRFYHLSLKVDILTATNQNISLLIEKNDTINIEIWKQKPDMEIMQVNLQDQKFTVFGMLEKTRLSIGNEKFFVYRWNGQNCGDFCINVLKANGVYNEEYKNFMYQDTTKITKNISQNSTNRLNIITKMGSIVSHLKGGKLEEEVRFI